MNKNINKIMINFLTMVNEENYENFIEVETEEELKTNMHKYYIEELNENDDFDIDDIEINWEGKGVYALVGHEFKCDYISKIENLINTEIDYFNDFSFPFMITDKLIYDIQGYYDDLKRENNCKYIYLDTEYAMAEHRTYVYDVIYTNEKVDNMEEIESLDLEDLFEYKFRIYNF